MKSCMIRKRLFEPQTGSWVLFAVLSCSILRVINGYQVRISPHYREHIEHRDDRFLSGEGVGAQVTMPPSGNHWQHDDTDSHESQQYHGKTIQDNVYPTNAEPSFNWVKSYSEETDIGTEDEDGENSFSWLQGEVIAVTPTLESKVRYDTDEVVDLSNVIAIAPENKASDTGDVMSVDHSFNKHETELEDEGLIPMSDLSPYNEHSIRDDELPHGKIKHSGVDIILADSSKNLDIRIVKKPVPLDVFKQQLKSIDTFHDIIRIFYGSHGHTLSNHELMRSMNKNKRRIGLSSSQLKRESSQNVPHNHNDFKAKTGNITKQLTKGARGVSKTNSNINACHKCHVVSVSNRLRDSVVNFRRQKHKRRHKRRRNKKQRRNRQPRDHSRTRDTKKEPSESEMMQAAIDHMNTMATKTLCQTPIPTVLHVRQLVRSANTLIYPECTIVYRCSNQIGCCAPGYECAMKTSENVTLPFMAMETRDNKVLPPDSRLENHVQLLTFENHTECHCQKITTCKPCPVPFILHSDKETKSCRCTCLDDNEECKRFRRGRKYFHPEDLGCLKSGRCGYPMCTYGNFTEEMLKRGRCPRKDENSKSASDSSEIKIVNTRNLKPSSGMEVNVDPWVSSPMTASSILPTFANVAVDQHRKPVNNDTVAVELKDQHMSIVSNMTNIKLGETDGVKFNTVTNTVQPVTQLPVNVTTGASDRNADEQVKIIVKSNTGLSNTSRGFNIDNVKPTTEGSGHLSWIESLERKNISSIHLTNQSNLNLTHNNPDGKPRNKTLLHNVILTNNSLPDIKSIKHNSSGVNIIVEKSGDHSFNLFSNKTFHNRTNATDPTEHIPVSNTKHEQYNINASFQFIDSVVAAYRTNRTSDVINLSEVIKTDNKSFVNNSSTSHSVSTSTIPPTIKAEGSYVSNINSSINVSENDEKDRNNSSSPDVNLKNNSNHGVNNNHQLQQNITLKNQTETRLSQTEESQGSGIDSIEKIGQN